MSFALLYWILMLLALVLDLWLSWPVSRANGGRLIWYVLFVLLGWKVFGAPIHS